jgi:hypothetical protein
MPMNVTLTSGRSFTLPGRRLFAVRGTRTFNYDDYNLHAVAKIGDSRAEMTLRWAVNHVSPLIRSAAARAVASAVFKNAH